MDIKQTFYAATRLEWRKWLKKNYKIEKEIWLVYYKKATGKPRIEYNDAVEEALCFGWIDSIVKKIDDQSFVQRFSRRNPKTGYSQGKIGKANRGGQGIERCPRYARRYIIGTI